MENFKKSGENKTKKEQYTLKIMKILRTTSLGYSFTGSYKKRSIVDSEGLCFINFQ